MAHWSYAHPELARFVRSRMFLPVAAVLGLTLLGGLGWGAVAVGFGGTSNSTAAPGGVNGSGGHYGNSHH